MVNYRRWVQRTAMREADASCDYETQTWLENWLQEVLPDPRETRKTYIVVMDEDKSRPY